MSVQLQHCSAPAGLPKAAPRRVAARRGRLIAAYAASKGSSGSGGQRHPATGDNLAAWGSLAKTVLGDVAAALSGSSAAASTSGRPASSSSSSLPEDLRSPAYGIIAANVAAFCAAVLLPAAPLLLSHRAPAPWQLLTSCFAHPSVEGLVHCIFFTYVFGRVVERSHGTLATWAVYLACGTAAAALAAWLLPARAGLLSSAAPAAAWGLFLVGVALPRAARKPLEVACLAPFALAATTARYAHLSTALVHDGAAIGQLVHVAGASVAAAAAAGVLAVVEAVHAEAERRRAEERRQAEAASQEAALRSVINAASSAVSQLGRKLGS